MLISSSGRQIHYGGHAAGRHQTQAHEGGIPWLWAHYAGGGGYRCWSGLGRIVAGFDEQCTHPEGHTVGSARGIQLWRVLDETLPFLLPVWLFVSLMKRFLGPKPPGWA